MADIDGLLDTLERLAAAVGGESAVSDALLMLTEQIAVVLGVTGAGVVLVRDGQLTDVTARVDAVADLERAMTDRQVGPCADATRSGQPVAVADLTVGDSAGRWPEYVARARRSGIRSVAAVPMLAGKRVVGTLGLYDSTGHAWTDEELWVARVLANIASCHLAQASTLDQEQQTNEQLREALTSRIIIEQAKGVLAEARGISVDEAFAVLRKHSRDHNARLHDVAAAVVNLRLRP